MSHRGRLALLFSTLLVAAACGGTGATTAPGGGGSAAPSAALPSDAARGAPSDAAPSGTAPSSSAPTSAEPSTGDGDDLLAAIQEAGVLRVSTDPNYAPQSFLDPDGSYEGFDIDVATEIAERLGVEVQFETPTFDAVVAGGWQGRWDVSVGSVTVTEERQEVLGFSQPYYYTPAQLAASEASGITDVEGFAGRAICVGSSTTYQFWLEGSLALVDAPTPADPPDGATASPLDTDQLCAQAIASGRTEFDGWLSSSTTVQAAIDADTPIVTVGGPVFFEPLAAAVDLNGPPHDELLAELDRIVGEMHDDGTLTALSEEWFAGLDLTTTNE
ncbi:MAG: transporter substrate-binding domain-containing protein [Chloroflexi bacterium]|nr:transporter substrate-binding domain-containing protein [Chloroflexota bacterium]